MAIQDINGLIAAINAGKTWRGDFFKLSGAAAHVAGNGYDLSQFGGNPFAGTYAGTALNAQVPDELSGWTLYHGGNVSADIKNVINACATAVGSNSAPGVLFLQDIALYYPGIDLKSTSLQTMVNGTALTRWTNGKGLKASIIVTTQSGGTPASTPVLSSFNYRDQDDNDGALTGVGTINFTAGAAGIPPVGKIVHAAPAANHPGLWLPLNAGDSGIKRVNSMQLSTAYTGSTTTTGVIVLSKTILSIPLGAVGSPSERNYLSMMPKIPDGAALSFFYFPGAAVAANSVFQGNLDFAWG